MLQHHLQAGFCALLLVAASGIPSVAQQARAQDQTSEPCAQVYACVESKPMTDEEARRSPAYHQTGQSARMLGVPTNASRASRDSIWSARKS